MEIPVDRVVELLSSIKHPELKKDIVALGIVQDLHCEGTEIHYVLRLLQPNDPFGGSLLRASQRLLSSEWPGAHVTASIQEAGPVKIDRDLRTGGLARVRHIIAVASGKGGVGKSTVTVNLAVSLARRGLRVGVLDADVYGPSLPIMLGVTGARPEVRKEGDEDLVVPIQAHGVKMLSMGFFVSPDDALVWRGPMASNGLKQLFHMGLWGELDFLLLDLPPGTSDIHLTSVQEIELRGALIVSTPQQVALADARKAVSMFQNKNVHVPILGLIENMSYFTPEELPDHRYYIFGRGGGQALSDELHLPFLGEIPLVQGIREGGDQGQPIATTPGPMAQAFDQLAERLCLTLQDTDEKPEST